MIANIEQLQEVLNAEKMPKYWYRICPKGYWEQGMLGIIDDKVVLDYEDNKWVIYYSERGQRNDYQEFSSESAACEFFHSDLNEMLAYKKEYLHVDFIPNWEKEW